MTDTKAPAASVGVLIEWALKVGPLLGAAALFFLTLYSNQAAMIKHDADVDRRLQQLETAANAQDRELTKRLALIDSAISELNHDLQFFQQTQQTRNGK